MVNRTSLSLLLLLASPFALAQYNLVGLGTLGGNNSFALDVSNLGQVSGNSSKTAGSPNPLNAFLYANGAMTNLGISFSGTVSRPVR